MPNPGGEPLYKMAALWVSSRRLPGTSQRNVLPIASIPCGGIVLLSNPASHAQRLEGSRFIRWQFYGLVSRRLPGTSRGAGVLWAGWIRRTE
jgi:hypothetical protein